MELTEDVIETESDGQPMAVLRKRPTAGSALPKVVMFHDGPGIREATHELARTLASQGFDVLVPDLYHRHGRMIGWELHEREANPSLVDVLWELVASLTDAGIQADLDAALVAAAVPPDERIAVIGFCLGARAVLRTMTRFPDRVVAGAMWHPSYLVDETPESPHRAAHALRRPLFIGIGQDDDVQPLANHAAFLDEIEGKPGVDVTVFPGAGHGYTWPGWPNHHPEAAAISLSRTVALFNLALRADH